ncbi:hypothetical protein DRO56_04265 [Candidatus Bathyarchaeota archaeon]|nr:MAG: hypothetical protein DRN97_11800 [Methanosarcinales archaeon]RLI32013.1 MAG: hypothetical protein DRO56_04265 [Candidatus Bathyarchaeota archaeon]
MKELKLIGADLLEIVDESLDEVFGRGRKRVIYYYLDRIFDIKREEIPENFGKFLRSLEELFGGGAEIIKRVIMKKLDKKLLMEQTI